MQLDDTEAEFASISHIPYPVPLERGVLAPSEALKSEAELDDRAKRSIAFCAVLSFFFSVHPALDRIAKRAINGINSFFIIISCELFFVFACKNTCSVLN